MRTRNVNNIFKKAEEVMELQRKVAPDAPSPDWYNRLYELKQRRIYGRPTNRRYQFRADLNKRIREYAKEIGL